MDFSVMLKYDTIAYAKCQGKIPPRPDKNCTLKRKDEFCDEGRDPGSSSVRLTDQAAEEEKKENADQKREEIAGHSVQKHGGGSAGRSQVGSVQQSKRKLCGADTSHIGDRVGDEHHH